MPSREDLCEIIRRNALTSLLFEVSATPKPGLVDRFNQGAHSDMDFFSFMASSAALSPYFYRCALMGASFQGDNPVTLLNHLRPVGLAAEKAMYMTTGGVNTHKGLIFSMGIVCAAAALCQLKGKSDQPKEKSNQSKKKGNKPEQIIDQPKEKGNKPGTEEICSVVSSMTQGICARELESIGEKPDITHGERIFLKCGAEGIRREVEDGFPTVRNCSLPVLSGLMSMNQCSKNDMLVHTLLHLMTVNEDTNILARHDCETLDYVRNRAAEVLEAGGMLTPEGKEMVYIMDRDFIARNISPGGSADLLAITIMFNLLSAG